MVVAPRAHILGLRISGTKRLSSPRRLLQAEHPASLVPDPAPRNLVMSALAESMERAMGCATFSTKSPSGRRRAARSLMIPTFGFSVSAVPGPVYSVIRIIIFRFQRSIRIPWFRTRLHWGWRSSRSSASHPPLRVRNQSGRRAETGRRSLPIGAQSERRPDTSPRW